METPAPTPQRPVSILTGVPPRDVLQKILDLLGVPAKVEDISANGSMRLFISTEDPARLIGKRGQTIYQLQFLLNRILLRANPDLPRIAVDCERKQDRQQESGDSKQQNREPQQQNREPQQQNRERQQQNRERPQQRPPEPKSEQRHDELLKHVDASAEKVRRWGEPLVVGPYDQSERDAIHRHFERDPELEVVSEPGQDTDRKRMMIRVRPVKSRA